MIPPTTGTTITWCPTLRRTVEVTRPRSSVACLGRRSTVAGHRRRRRVRRHHHRRRSGCRAPTARLAARRVRRLRVQRRRRFTVARRPAPPGPAGVGGRGGAAPAAYRLSRLRSAWAVSSVPLARWLLSPPPMAGEGCAEVVGGRRRQVGGSGVLLASGSDRASDSSSGHQDRRHDDHDPPWPAVARCRCEVGALSVRWSVSRLANGHVVGLDDEASRGGGWSSTWTPVT